MAGDTFDVVKASLEAGALMQGMGPQAAPHRIHMWNPHITFPMAHLDKVRAALACPQVPSSEPGPSSSPLEASGTTGSRESAAGPKPLTVAERAQGSPNLT